MRRCMHAHTLCASCVGVCVCVYVSVYVWCVQDNNNNDVERQKLQNYLKKSFDYLYSQTNFHSSLVCKHSYFVRHSWIDRSLCSQWKSDDFWQYKRRAKQFLNWPIANRSVTNSTTSCNTVEKYRNTHNLNNLILGKYLQMIMPCLVGLSNRGNLMMTTTTVIIWIRHQYTEITILYCYRIYS